MATDPFALLEEVGKLPMLALPLPLSSPSACSHWSIGTGEDPGRVSECRGRGKVVGMKKTCMFAALHFFCIATPTLVFVAWSVPATICCFVIYSALLLGQGKIILKYSADFTFIAGI